VGEFEICRDRLGGAASDDDDCGWSISGINGREVGGGGGGRTGSAFGEFVWRDRRAELRNVGFTIPTPYLTSDSLQIDSRCWGTHRNA